MTYSPRAQIYQLLQRTIAVSPVPLMGWAVVSGAVMPSTPAAIDSAAVLSTSLSPEAIAIDSASESLQTAPADVAATVTVPTAIAPPQFGQASSPIVIAQAITAADDGTGTVVTQTDNTFDITGGTLAGDNLFHSFEQFGLSADQIANILATPDIENVLGRISGGNPSVIDGLLQLTGGDANLFLINPAGIIFGPESQVIVPAAFTATSADAIQFDDEWFQAVGANDYATLVGDPTGFAFTGTDPGVVMNAGSITSLMGNQVTLLGGTVINTGTIETPSGTVTIAAVPGENLVRISQEGSLLSLELPTQDQALLSTNGTPLATTSLPELLTGSAIPDDSGLVLEDGVIRLASTDTPIPTDAGTAIVSGTLDAADTTATGVGGAIDVTGDRVGLLNATLDASGNNGGGTIRVGGDYQGQGEIPNAQQTYVSSDSAIAADALTHGEGGRIIVWADDVTQFFGTITAQGGSESGNGGFAEVSGKESLRYEGQAFLNAPMGEVGQLLLDPGIVLIGMTNIDDGLLIPSNPGDPIFIAEDQGGTSSTFQISTDQLRSTLNNSDVTISAAQRIDLIEALDASEADNDLALNAPEINLAENLIQGNGNLTKTTANSSTTADSDISISSYLILTDGGNITLNGPIIINPSDDDLRIDTGFDTGGNITLNDTLDSEFITSPIDVDLVAGTGNVTLSAAAGGLQPLGALEVDGNDINLRDFVGDELTATATNFDLQAQGDLVLEEVNITGSDSLNINTGGTLTLNIADSSRLQSFSGDITLTSQGDLTLANTPGILAFTAQNLAINSGNNVSLQNLGILETLTIPQNITINAQNTLTIGNSEVESGAELTLTGNAISIANSELEAGQTLNLLAQDTVAISDSVAGSTRFLSGSDMTIRGNTSITINALDQPDSVFRSSGNLDLMSNGAIAGNGRFLADGDITIATIAGDPGMFSYSPFSSPGIVSADGNVSFGDYTGPALKVEATGNISGGDITITEPNTTLTETDPDIPILSTTSALVLRAGLSPYQLVTDQLPSIETAQNEPNVSSTNPSYAVGTNSFEFDGAASSPASIEVGRINTSAAEGAVILQASGDIVTGNINVGEGVSEFLDPGDIDISAGGSFCPAQACTVPPDIRGESVTIVALNDINTGDIETVDIAGGDIDPSTSFVRLRAETGDIQVGYIWAGAGGIDIDAAGVFRALNFRGSSVNRTAAETIPSTLAQYLNSLGYTEFPDEISFGDFVEGPESETGVRVSLESVDGSIAIRYGARENREVLVPDTNGVLIEGNPSQPFVIGPNYDEFAPFLPGEGRNFDPYDSTTNPNGYFPPDEFFSTFEVIENAEPLIFPSNDFPSDTGGVVAGIVASNTDASLSGSLQSQLFGTDGTIPDPGAIGAPQSVVFVRELETTDFCEDIRQDDIVFTEDLLNIDEIIVAEVLAPVSTQNEPLVDPCNYREILNESVDSTEERLEESDEQNLETLDSEERSSLNRELHDEPISAKLSSSSLKRREKL